MVIMKANIMKAKILVLLLIEISLISLFSASAVFAREELQEGSVGTTPGNMTTVIEDIIEDYNANLAGMPWIVKSVMGTETIRAEITLKDGTSQIVGLKTKDGLIVEHQLGPYPVNNGFIPL